MDIILEVVTWLWSLTGVKFVSTHTLINVVFAVSAALRTKDFVLSKTPEFLWRKLLPLVLVYGAVKAVGVDAGLDYLAPVVFGLIEVALLSDLTDNLTKLGVPLPSQITNVFNKGD